MPQSPAEQAIDAIAEAAQHLADAVVTEQQLENERCIAMSAAIERIMATTNPLTQKPHSASSAKEIVETDVEYMTYRHAQAAAVRRRICAWSALKAAELRAELEIVLARRAS